MANPELLRLIDSIHRDKDVDKDIIFEALEAAMLSAARKQCGNRPEVTVQIDRETGAINVFDGEVQLDPLELGRISAQTAKQIIIQRIREAERDVVYADYERRIGEIVSGVIQRYEGITVVVNLGKTEGYLPKREQVPGETYRPGERVRALVLDVKKLGPKVKITLSRTHPDLIRRLFELEVPEISDHTIEIKALAREPGARSKVGVFSVDSKVDCVGACVGVRGTRIKNIVDELNGEKIDIVRWSDSMDLFIANALRPAEISTIHMDADRMRAVVLVPEDQLALGIGKKGQNVRLASKIVGWDIDIHSAQEFENIKEEAKQDFAKLGGIDARTAAKIVESGIYSLHEFADSDGESLFEFEGITKENLDALQDAAIAMIREKRRAVEARKVAEAAQKAAETAAAATAAEAPPEGGAAAPAEAAAEVPAEGAETSGPEAVPSETPEGEPAPAETGAAPEPPPAESAEPAAQGPSATEPAEAGAEAPSEAAETPADEGPPESPEPAAEEPAPAPESTEVEQAGTAETEAEEPPATAEAPAEETGESGPETTPEPEAPATQEPAPQDGPQAAAEAERETVAEAEPPAPSEAPAEDAPAPSEEATDATAPSREAESTREDAGGDGSVEENKESGP